MRKQFQFLCYENTIINNIGLMNYKRKLNKFLNKNSSGRLRC